MCGICGIYGKNDENLIKRMCRVMFHRSPDDEGVYTRKPPIRRGNGKRRTARK